jgi:hypothetical protein
MTSSGQAPETELRLPGRKKAVRPTGLALVDGLARLSPPAVAQYVAAVSQYVVRAPSLDQNTKKAAQIRLSYALGQALIADVKTKLNEVEARAGEHKVAGALRVVKADVSEYHQLDGLRLAIEIKPVNLAVGRALWNRFGDVRAFAVNIHLKFPFCVVGGVLVIPTYEVTKKGAKKSTMGLIDRTINRLVRAGRRRNESEAGHLLEGIGLIVYDPDTGLMDKTVPSQRSGLRWESFIAQIAEAYDTRFGEGTAASLITSGAEESEDDDDEDSSVGD